MGDWLADNMKGALADVWDWLMTLVFGWVPWWGWAGLALVLLVIIWRIIGKEGVITGAVAVAAFFAYRAGWRAGRRGDPIDKPPTMWPDKMPKPKSKPKPKPKVTTIWDRLKRKSK